MSLFVNGNETERFLDVEEVARIRLQHSPYRALRRVTCHFSNGVLFLRGSVATYHYKQLAQVTVTDIAGVDRIVNDVEVDAALPTASL